ncbi:hypothetical protein AAEU31_12310 [Pseudoalteromonas sp. SSMSWG5]|mgnify:CR=1 FL=1|jgi:hypothetical protein|uniref:hypothetical protein n=1 Tax=Pseudoalteromonas TaxID=53246 RepID=UPI000C5CE709|nr:MULTISPECIES: hypothetical protein [unclassified Pseudoalteromonas]MBD56989.1 hypothetical protein [Pseudoalteromonas sp.]MEC8208788.1 hypothetical protein [Pseudomonadota bacterium]MCF2902332.1 hypothetical protein [Pseudoalteromonas sp. OFAV1]MCF2920967.1 hypothetical protein [Pseudoalteromonas sp. APAL1]MCO7249463.1 hypothetical protein [Pseudoalteromonas sp. Ps84H-4]|tara:strand:- start:1816 stop:2235 length:420 start_codon:yes stop_codon:yes gene_type:complete
MTPPAWLKPLAWAALVWNLLGVFAFIMQQLMTPEMIALLPENQQDAYRNIPLWSTAAFAVAVFSACLGSIMLIVRKALAREFFLVSFIAVLVQQYYNFVVIDSLAMFGSSALAMPFCVIVIGLVLLLISNKGKQESWLN